MGFQLLDFLQNKSTACVRGTEVFVKLLQTDTRARFVFPPNALRRSDYDKIDHSRHLDDRTWSCCVDPNASTGANVESALSEFYGFLAR